VGRYWQIPAALPHPLVTGPMSVFDPTHPLIGLKVLLVEDEPIISIMVEEMLLDLGAAEVRHAGSVAGGRILLAQEMPDVAVLDVNLAGEPCYPLAERLRETGVPILFASGYGREGLAAGWSDAPSVQKPFRIEVLSRALAALLRPPG
jgi:DNA-binding response OmpR family regulator